MVRQARLRPELGYQRSRAACMPGSCRGRTAPFFQGGIPGAAEAFSPLYAPEKMAISYMENVSRMISGKHRGARNELAAAVWLMDRGYVVFRNLSDRGPIDMIAMKDGELLFLDSKTNIASRPYASEEQMSLGVKYITPVEDGFAILQPEPKEELVCVECGKIFNPFRKQKIRKFCSRLCKTRSQFSRRKGVDNAQT